MNKESGPTPYHPSTWEILSAYLPTFPTRESLEGWIPSFRNPLDISRMPLAIMGGGASGLGLGGLSTAFAQDNPPAFYQQTAADIADVTADSPTSVEPVSEEVLDAPIFPSANPWYRPTVKFEEGMGYVATDNLRITHTYDPESGLWYELEKYIPLGTAEQRMNTYLQKLLTGTNTTDLTKIVDNVLDLDLNEVNTYIRTGRSDNFHSFRILPNAKGEPAIILVTGGQYGMSTSFGNIDQIVEAVKLMNEVDPTIIDTLTIQFGLRAISADIAPGGLFNRLAQPSSNFPGYAATLDRSLGIVIYNEKGAQNVGIHIGRIIIEARGLYDSHHIIPSSIPQPLVLIDNNLIDPRKHNQEKSLFLKSWVETYAAKLPEQIAKQLISYTDAQIEAFSVLDKTRY